QRAIRRRPRASRPAPAAPGARAARSRPAPAGRRRFAVLRRGGGAADPRLLARSGRLRSRAGRGGARTAAALARVRPRLGLGELQPLPPPRQLLPGAPGRNRVVLLRGAAAIP